MSTQESSGSWGIAVKILVIIGFIATLVFFVQLLIKGIVRLPDAFSSLASIADSVNKYRPEQEQNDAEVAVDTQTPQVPASSTPRSTQVPVVTKQPPTPTYTHPGTPVYITMYPQSDPNGFIDLSMNTVGVGVMKNGIFTYTAKYNRDSNNAIKFDVKNVGTKTSSTWTFKAILPSGQIFESPIQTALKPQEHVTFTLGFGAIEKKDINDNLAKITSTVSTKNDTNSKNDTSVWHVVTN